MGPEERGGGGETKERGKNSEGSARLPENPGGPPIRRKAERRCANGEETPAGPLWTEPQRL